MVFDLEVHDRMSIKQLFAMVKDKCPNRTNYTIKGMTHRGINYEDAANNDSPLFTHKFEDGQSIGCKYEYSYSGINYGYHASTTTYYNHKDPTLTVEALENFVNGKDYVNVLLALVQIMIDYSTTTNLVPQKKNRLLAERARLLGDKSWQFLQQLPTHKKVDGMLESLARRSRGGGLLGEETKLDPTNKKNWPAVITSLDPLVAEQQSEASMNELLLLNVPIDSEWWSNALDSDPSLFVQTSYRLQVVDAMLLPQVSEVGNEEASNFRKIFIKTGGFNAVVDLLLRRTNDRRRTIDTTLGHGVSHFCFGIALRIAKFCVLGGLVGKGLNVIKSGIIKPTEERTLIDKSTTTTTGEEKKKEVKGGGKEEEEEEEEENDDDDDGTVEDASNAASDIHFPRLLRSFSQDSSDVSLTSIDLYTLLSRLIEIITAVYTEEEEEKKTKQNVGKAVGVTTGAAAATAAAATAASPSSSKRRVQKTKETPGITLNDKRQMSLDCLVMVQGILQSDPNMLRNFFKKDDTSGANRCDALLPLLLYCDDVRLRKKLLALFMIIVNETTETTEPTEVIETTEETKKSSDKNEGAKKKKKKKKFTRTTMFSLDDADRTSMLEALFSSVRSNFSNLRTKKPGDPTEFFQLFETILVRSRASSSSTSFKTTSEQDDTKTSDDEMLDALTTRIERYDPNDEERVLSGYLNLIKVVVEGRSTIPEETQRRLLTLMFDVCLFRVPTMENPHCRTLCSSRLARKAAFDVLRCLSKVSDEARVDIMQRVEQFRRSVTEPRADGPEESKEGVSKESASKEGESKEGESKIKSSKVVKPTTLEHVDLNLNVRYVGLKNQGATCYMNATLQVLYRDPVLRSLVLNSEWSELMEGEKEEKEEKEEDKKEVAVVEEGEEEEGESSIKKKPSRKVIKLSKEHATMMQELQHTFLYLQEGSMEYYDARPLVMSSKSLNLLNDVLHQNDVRDYIDKLLDRLEIHMQKHDESSETSSSEFQRRYKGQWAYETRRFGDNIPEEYRVVTRHEPFVAVAATVRGCNTLEDSLLAMVQGEKMEGENQLACDFLPPTDDGKDQRCNGLRRDVLNKLPDMLMIHLKRFEYDVQTYQMAKVKEKFLFPMKINMWRYTREGCEEADRKQEEQEELQVEEASGEAEAGGEAEAEAGGEAEADGEAKAATEDHAVAAEGTEKEEKKNVEEEGGEESGESKEEGAAEQHDDYDYELVGVIVHDGATEQSGHYYSYAREPKETGGARWFKYNDKRVSEFSPESSSEIEWFGGTQTVQVLDNFGKPLYNNQTRQEMRNNSAYMLVYQRTTASAAPSGVDNKEIGKKNQVPTNSQTESWSFDRKAVLNKIWKDNDLSMRTGMLFDPNFLTFMRDLLVMTADTSKSERKKENGGASAAGAGGAADAADAADAAATSTSLRVTSSTDDTIVTSAYEFFASIVVKAKDKSDVEKWVNVITNMLESAPRPSIRVLQDCSEDDWMLEKLLKENNPLLKSAHAKICNAAVKSYFLDKSMSDEDRSRFLREKEEDVPEDGDKGELATLGRLIGKMLRMLNNEILRHHRLVNNWRRMVEFFVMLQELLQNRVLCEYACEIDLLYSALAFFVGGSLKGMETWTSIVKNPQVRTHKNIARAVLHFLKKLTPQTFFFFFFLPPPSLFLTVRQTKLCSTPASRRNHVSESYRGNT